MSQLPINNITRTSKNRVIYTIGHSNISTERLIEKLMANGIERLVDVRSNPYSHWCPQFNREQLEYELAVNDINYDWRGNNLGGLGVNVDYDKTLQWVYNRAEYENIALMCSEGDYRKCHRYLTLAPALEQLGAEIAHISR
mgnify:CR=1 FL=1